MALIYKADIQPTKLELLAAWLPTRPWYGGRAAALHRVAAYRFDDPAGEVGIETLLVSGGHAVFQVPLTYRGAPLDGADEWLVGTMEHSVLGRRWVYDGCGDPVYADALATAVLTGSGQADELMEGEDGRLEPRPLTMTITTTAATPTDAPKITTIHRVLPGHPTLIAADGAEIAVLRDLDNPISHFGAALMGSWEGRRPAVPLAFVAAR